MFLPNCLIESGEGIDSCPDLLPQLHPGATANESNSINKSHCAWTSRKGIQAIYRKRSDSGRCCPTPLDIRSVSDRSGDFLNSGFDLDPSKRGHLWRHSSAPRNFLSPAFVKRSGILESLRKRLRL